MAPSFERELDAAVRAAEAGGKILLTYYRNDPNVEYKKGDDPVTAADRECDALLRERLMAEFPETGWLSEETVDSENRLTKDRVWVVDPLDGTREFVGHVDEFAISIALVDRGRPVVGVIFNPAAGRMWRGSRGGGVFEGDRPVRCPDRAPPARPRALVSRTDSKKGWFQPFGEKYDVVARGSVAYKLACLASGDGDLTFTVTPRSEWDICAGVLLAELAGYTVTDIRGSELLFNRPIPKSPGVAAAHPAAHADLLAILKFHHRLD